MLSKRARVLPLLVAIWLPAACSGGSRSSKSDSTPTTAAASVAPATGDVYQPPANLRSAPPGTRIWTQFFAQRANRGLFPVATTVWLMLYHSRDRTGHDIAVSGFAVVPNGRAPSGGRPVYAWAHGDVGLGDQCAPSKRLAANLPAYGAEQLARGAVLVATDYEGLGTPGEHPYLVADSEAHAILDSIRAAATLPAVGRIGDVVVAGIGEGGAAALVAAERAKDYAPELHVRGVVALAPDAELPTMITSTAAPDFAVTVAAGFAATYPDFDPRAFLTPAASADIPHVRTECAATTANRYANTRPHPLSQDPNNVSAVHELLVDNSPGEAAGTAPILLVQGSRDKRTPPQLTASLRRRYCALHATVERIVTPADHAGIIGAARTRVLHWIDERYAGTRAPTRC